MREERAQRQDIRPLRVAILNLMPTKVTTETQLLRLLGNSSLQVGVTLLHTASLESRNVPAEHLVNHYKSFRQVNRQKFDGLIITSFANWLNYFVYQVTPYHIRDLPQGATYNDF